MSLEQRRQTSATPNHHCHREPGMSQYTQPGRCCCQGPDDTHTPPGALLCGLADRWQQTHSPALLHAPATQPKFHVFTFGQLLNSLQCLIHWSITEKHFEKHHIQIGRYCACRCDRGTELASRGWSSACHIIQSQKEKKRLQKDFQQINSSTRVSSDYSS